MTLDTIALVPRYPDADERIVGEVVTIAGGGPAATAAVVLARQGVPVAVVGRVGGDAAGEQAVRLLAAEGVDVSAIFHDPDVPTQASCIVVAKNKQTRAISTLVVPPLPPIEHMGPAAAALLAGAEWVHTDHLGFAAAAPFLRGIEASRRPLLAVDAGNLVAGLNLAELALYVPTTESLVRQFGLGHTPEGIDEAARRALSLGARAVVATRGAHGSTAWWSGDFHAGRAAGHLAVPALGGVDIVSTLGAGDVFHGALLAALCRGCDWKAALTQANATAALSCRVLDGTSAVPTLEALMEVLRASPHVEGVCP